MIKSKTPFLLLLIALTLAPYAASGEASQDQEANQKASALLAEAKDSWHRKQDYNRALDAFNEAVELAPEDLEIRVHRANFFETMSKLVVEEDREQFAGYARADYEFIAEADPNSVGAGVARDGLGRLDGRDLFPKTPVECPKDATEAYAQAEELFQTGEYERALKFYEVATSACPKNAEMFVYHADAYFALGDYPNAKRLFLRALEADPWDRQAHRFLADTLSRMGDNELGLHHAALAVTSDPTYEAAWSALRSFARALDRGWERIYSDKPTVEADPDSDDAGNMNITLTLPGAEEGEDETAQGENEEKVDPDQITWITYAINKALALNGETIGEDEAGEPTTLTIEPSEMTPFEVEELAVRSALEMDEDSDEQGSFWAMMRRASDASYLSEAIYLHMMDAKLVEDYVAYRAENGERLAAYLETLIVPASGEE